MNALNLLRQRHNLHLPDEALQSIVNTCAEIIIMQDQQEFEDETRRAIDEAGGCSRCGDLDGYSCICDDDDDFQPCYGCDNPDSCSDYGCAEKAGLKEPGIPGVF